MVICLYRSGSDLIGVLEFAAEYWRVARVRIRFCNAPFSIRHSNCVGKKAKVFEEAGVRLCCYCDDVSLLTLAHASGSVHSIYLYTSGSNPGY